MDILYEMRLEKTGFRISDQVRHKPVYAATEESLGFRKNPCSKNKGADQLRSFAADLCLCFLMMRLKYILNVSFVDRCTVTDGLLVSSCLFV